MFSGLRGEVGLDDGREHVVDDPGAYQENDRNNETEDRRDEILLRSGKTGAEQERSDGNRLSEEALGPAGQQRVKCLKFIARRRRDGRAGDEQRAQQSGENC